MSENVLPMSVIVIDDDEFFRLAVTTVLQTRLAINDVVACSSVEEAMSHLENGESFSMALVDLNMPGVENKALLETLKRTRPDLCLVVVSGSRSRDDVLMTISAGGHGFVNKGLGIDNLEQALRRIIDGAIYIPPFMTEPSPSAIEPAPTPRPSGLSLKDTSLTVRQRDVLRLLVEGMSNKCIGRTLGLSPGTVKFHLSAIFRALGVENRVEAALVGAQLMEFSQNGGRG